jgi:hypothetical protein
MMNMNTVNFGAIVDIVDQHGKSHQRKEDLHPVQKGILNGALLHNMTGDSTEHVGVLTGVHKSGGIVGLTRENAIAFLRFFQHRLGVSGIEVQGAMKQRKAGSAELPDTISITDFSDFIDRSRAKKHQKATLKTPAIPEMSEFTNPFSAIGIAEHFIDNCEYTED